MQGAEVSLTGKRYDNALKLLGLVDDANFIFDTPIVLDSPSAEEVAKGSEATSLPPAGKTVDRIGVLANAVFGLKSSSA